MAVSSDLTDRAEALHRSAFVADGHADTLGRLYFEGGTLAGPAPERHVDLDRLARGGVALQVMACCPVREHPPVGTTPAHARAVFGMLDLAHRELAAHPELRLIDGAAALENLAAARRAGGREIGVVLAIEGGEALEGDLALLRVYHRLGVRLLTLTHNPRNELADGVGEAESGGGLTHFGRQAVAEMNRLGMVIDVSHLSPAGFWQVLGASSAPVVASHSNAQALCRHRRNLTDEQAKALAEQGGVIGVTFAPQFLRDAPEGATATLDRFRRWAAASTSLTDVLDHLDHFMELVGPEHLSLGSDFDGIDAVPAGLEDASRLPALTRGLLERGYPEEAVRGILGGNLRRLFQTVWSRPRAAPA